MSDYLDHLRQQADRAKRWAESIPDPWERERMKAVARDYAEMAHDAEREAANQND